MLCSRTGNSAVESFEPLFELGVCAEPLSRYGGVETMREVVDRLQGSAPKPPGRLALCRRVRLGTGPPRRGPPVPDVAQSLPRISGPKRDQFQTSNVTGESMVTLSPAFTHKWQVTRLIYKLVHLLVIHSSIIYLLLIHLQKGVISFTLASSIQLLSRL